MKRTALTLWFVAAAVLIALDSFVCYMSVRKLVDISLSVSESRELIMEGDRLLSTLKDAETGQRGYIITGEESYLEPYRKAVDDVERRESSLREKTRSNAAQSRRSDELAAMVKAKLDELAETIALRREKGFEAARMVVQQDVGKVAMDSARRIAAEIRTAEEAVLARRSGERDESTRRAVTTLAVAGVLNVLLLTAVGEAVRRHGLQKEKALLAAEQRIAVERENVRLGVEIEERRKNNEQLQLLTSRLEQSNRELESFASVASHDLQEPLRKVQAFGDRLRTRFADALGEEGKDYVNRMHAAAQRMQTLINDLLSFSRVTTKAQPFVKLDLGEIAREVLVDLESRIESTQGQVELGTFPNIEADPLQMRQLLQNLIANALKFRKSDVPPVVKVSASQHSVEGVAGVEIRVADNGIGFDEKYLDRIFNVFQRLHGRQQYEGTGIGLAVCRKIAERHGGTITATSSEGVGSTFIVWLPLVHAKQGV